MHLKERNAKWHVMMDRQKADTRHFCPNVRSPPPASGHHVQKICTVRMAPNTRLRIGFILVDNANLRRYRASLRQVFGYCKRFVNTGDGIRYSVQHNLRSGHFRV